MINVVNAKPERYLHFYTGTGGLKKGQLAILDSSTAIEAPEAVSTAILLGVAMEDADATEICTIYPLTGTELEMDIYQGGSTDVFAAANVGTPFDPVVVSEEFFIDPNDANGGYLVLMSYDNTAQKAYVRALNSVIYVG
ncbi:MAG: hypothetical protein WCY09_10000 [Candidatus Omnitrophota bacterium]